MTYIYTCVHVYIYIYMFFKPAGKHQTSSEKLHLQIRHLACPEVPETCCCEKKR